MDTTENESTPSAVNRPVLFLGVEGVLGDSTLYPNGYCDICPGKIELLNSILRSVPECQIVLMAYWRRDVMDVAAIETVLALHGAEVGKKFPGRVHGATEVGQFDDVLQCAERDKWPRVSFDLRDTQISRYVEKHRLENWCVLDCGALFIKNLIKVDPKWGLSPQNVVDAIEVLSGSIPAA